MRRVTANPPAMLMGNFSSNAAGRAFRPHDTFIPNPAEDIVLETSRPLDRAGTRQALRYPMNRRLVAVNGESGQLIDLSVSGAQVQSAIRLRPLKVGRLVIPDESGDIRIQGTIAWAIGVPSGGTIQYRAGIEFVKADKQVLAAFCEKHGGTPDPILGKQQS